MDATSEEPQQPTHLVRAVARKPPPSLLTLAGTPAASISLALSALLVAGAIGYSVHHLLEPREVRRYIQIERRVVPSVMPMVEVVPRIRVVPMIITLTPAGAIHVDPRTYSGTFDGAR